METTIISYGNGIYAIDQQMVRAFVIVGEKKALLIDTGAQPIQLSQYVKEITELPVEMCLSHSDGDHTKNVGEFQQIFVHAGELPELEKQFDLKSKQMKIIDEGYVFDLGNREIEVIHIPGHTRGSLGFVDRRNKLLFSGDTVSYGPVYMFGEKRSMEQYRNSLNKLKKMAEEGIFTTVYPCHNTCPIGADVIDELISCADGIFDGSIHGEPANMPFATNQPITLCKYKRCGIYLFENQ